MKVAVLGAGAVGSYYGAKLARSGHEVHFLLRSDYEQVKRRGVFIKSPEGDFNVRPKTALDPAQIGVSDLVLIGLKTTANDQLPALISPLADSHTAILTLQNGLGNEETLARTFPPDQILGGLCFVCLNRISPGVIHHIAHGKMEMGEYRRWPEPRTHDIASAFRHAGVLCSVRDNLEKAHWEKLVWNIPFNGLGVASSAGYEAVLNGIFNPSKPLQKCLTTDLLLANPGWFELVRRLMEEVITAANAKGFAIPLDFADEQIAKTRIMGAYHPSTVIDFERGLPVEIETLFLEPSRQAEIAGVKTPILRNVCEILAGLDQWKKGYSG